MQKLVADASDAAQCVAAEQLATSAAGTLFAFLGQCAPRNLHVKLILRQL